MKLTPTDIPGVVIVEQAVYGDQGGWYLMRFTPIVTQKTLEPMGLSVFTSDHSPPLT